MRCMLQPLACTNWISVIFFKGFQIRSTLRGHKYDFTTRYVASEFGKL
jgi:hypothetical protein